MSTSEAQADLESKRVDLIQRLRKDRNWFILRRKQLQAAWISLTLVSLIFGLLTTIFIAMGWPDQTTLVGKASLVALPAISTFCGTILATFRLRENWELRELGRIDVDELIVKASFLSVDESAKFYEGLYDISIARVNLSRQ